MLNNKIQVGNIKVVDAIWYDGTFGVIKTIDTTTNETKIYMGAALHPAMISEEASIIQIVKMGTKYSPQDFENLLKWLEVKK